MPHHLRLNFNLVEVLSGVNANNRADHLGDNDHITEVGLYEVWLFVGLGLLLGLTELLDQTHWLAFEATVEPSASSSVDEVTEFFRGEIKESK